MFAKLLIAILVAAATAGALLVNRQVRLDAAHEMARLHTRLTEGERELWKLRGRIAERCRPDRLRRAIDHLGGVWVAVQWDSDGTEGEAAGDPWLTAHSSLRASVP